MVEHSIGSGGGVVVVSVAVVDLLFQFQNAVPLVRRQHLDLVVTQTQDLHDQSGLCVCVCVCVCESEQASE